MTLLRLLACSDQAVLSVGDEALAVQDDTAGAQDEATPSWPSELFGEMAIALPPGAPFEHLCEGSVELSIDLDGTLDEGLLELSWLVDVPAQPDQGGGTVEVEGWLVAE